MINNGYEPNAIVMNEWRRRDFIDDTADEGWINTQETSVLIRMLGLGCDAVPARIIAAEMGVTPSRVQQIVRSGLWRLARRRRRATMDAKV